MVSSGRKVVGSYLSNDFNFHRPKQFILEDAKKRILKNHMLEQIAVSQCITKRTLNI